MRRVSGRVARGPRYTTNLVLLFALLGIGLLVAVAKPGAHASALNVVQIENKQQGTQAWRVRLLPQHALEGFASEVSILPGQTLHLHVSSALRLKYRVVVYRIGWYDGTGGRRMPCMACRVHRAAARAIPSPDPRTGMLSLTWPVTDAVPVGQGWVSGYYVADLVVQSGHYMGWGSWVPFVVRELPTRDAPVLVQASVNTWQAYNRWGGRSLYWNHTGVGDNHVSFNRPYDMSGAPAFGGSQANLPTAWEFSLARFLERYGYDIAYTTDVDTDADPAELLRHKLDIVSGHDEYWTKAMRDGFDQARDSGVNLAFIGANIGYWQVRYEDSRRTIVEYRNAKLDPERDPMLKTVQFRNLVPPRPECELVGVQWGEIGDAAYTPVGAVSARPDPWFAGTGFTGSETLPDLVGYEYDSLDKACEHPGTTILFESKRPNHLDADAVRYRVSSGATVFAAGSIRFAVGLDPLSGYDNPRLEMFMRNALNSTLR